MVLVCYISPRALVSIYAWSSGGGGLWVFLVLVQPSHIDHYIPIYPYQKHNPKFRNGQRNKNPKYHKKGILKNFSLSTRYILIF